MSNHGMVRQAKETNEGDSVVVKRLFPVVGYMNFDPFVLWDHFNVKPGSGFPDHPHRGFEAITYMLSGSMEHKDNLGNASRVGVGGAQRFTAGKGIVHSEMPGADGSNEGIQLWINLPRTLKTSEPSYQQVDQHDFPVESITAGKIITIVGEGSPLMIKTPLLYKQLALNENGRYVETVPPDFRGLIYVVNGQASIDQQSLTEGEALFIERGGIFEISSMSPCVIMLCFGKSHGEPIYQHGSFVD